MLVGPHQLDGVMPLDLGPALVDELARALGGSLNVRRTALRLVALVQSRVADWAMVVLPDGRIGGLTLIGDAATSGVVIRAAQVDHTHLGRVLRTGRTEQVEGADLSGLIPVEPFRDAASTLAPAEVLACGLTARGATFGALVVVRHANSGFSAGDVALLEHVAERAALALDSARLYEERVRVASTLQEGLRPPSIPDVPGLRLAATYRPAAEHLDIGGDFYDVTGRDDDWLLSIGDVCGKGIEAAAVTGRTRQSIRTAAYFDRNPAALLSAVNSVLHDSMSAPFVTVLCARLRPRRDGTLTAVELATAGHPAPLVLRADGRVEQIEVFGTAAGITAKTTYGLTATELRHGDTMLMFTDGVDEAPGDGGQYGLERLRAFLPDYAGASARIICDAVEQDVMEHLDGRPHDDIALLAATCGI